MNIDINKIATQFQNKTLPKSEWTHLAHIAVAFVEMDTHKDFNIALCALRNKIKEYNLAVGTENTDNSGYHETLTVFWLTIVHEFYNAYPPLSIEEVFNKFTKTRCATSQFSIHFYSKDLLFSKEARHHWVLPDLLDISEISAMISL